MYYITSAKKEAKEQNLPSYLVDAGNVFFKYGKKFDPGSEFEQIEALAIAKAYLLMEYDAIGVAPRDLEGGKKFFAQKEVQDLPLVSCNVVIENNQPVFAPFLLKTIDEFTVAIFGVTGRSDHIKGFTIIDWHTALQKQLSITKDQAHFFIVLSSLDMHENQELAILFPEIDLIISTSPTYGNIANLINKECLIAQVKGEGSMLGQLHFNWSAGAKEWREEEREPEKIKTLLTEKKTKIAVLEKELRNTSEIKQHDRLHWRIQQESRKKEVLTSRLNFQKENKTLLAQNKINTFRTHFHTVYPRSDSQEIEDIVKEIITRKKALRTR